MNIHPEEKHSREAPAREAPTTDAPANPASTNEAPVRELLIRSAMYELLSLAFLYPEEGRAALLREGAGKLRAACLEMGWQDLAGSLDRAERQMDALDDRALEREYIVTFGHTISTDCPPYETEYDQAHVFQKSQTLADLGAFYRAFGVGPNPQIKERLDHISVEMEFMNLLTLKEAYALAHQHGEDKVRLCRQAQQGFLTHHLAEWINSFVHRLSRRTGGVGVYASLGMALDRHLNAEFDRFGLDSVPFDPEEVPVAVEEEPDCAACPLADGVPLEMPQEMKLL